MKFMKRSNESMLLCYCCCAHHKFSIRSLLLLILCSCSEMPHCTVDEIQKRKLRDKRNKIYIEMENASLSLHYYCYHHHHETKLAQKLFQVKNFKIILHSSF